MKSLGRTGKLKQDKEAVARLAALAVDPTQIMRLRRGEAELVLMKAV